jgi:hypothetical protein
MTVRTPIGLDPEGHPCVLHAYHAPRPILNHRHHVVPLSWGGVGGTWESVCPTGHENVHEVLNYMLAYGDPYKVPGAIRRTFGGATWDMAKRGWDLTLIPIDDRPYTTNAGVAPA